MPIARARVARFTRAIPRSASTASYILNAKLILSKYRHGPKLWASQNIFAGKYLFGFFQIWPYPRQNSMYSGPRRRPGRQAHGSIGLAPRHYVRCPCDFLGLINTSRTSLVRNNERYLAFSSAVPQAFLEVSDLRYNFLPKDL